MNGRKSSYKQLRNFLNREVPPGFRQYPGKGFLNSSVRNPGGYQSGFEYLDTKEDLVGKVSKHQMPRDSHLDRNCFESDKKITYIDFNVLLKYFI